MARPADKPEVRAEKTRVTAEAMGEVLEEMAKNRVTVSQFLAELETFLGLRVTKQSFWHWKHGVNAMSKRSRKAVLKWVEMSRARKFLRLDPKYYKSGDPAERRLGVTKSIR